jgi:hypothetical protein
VTEYNVCKLFRLELTVPKCRLSFDLKTDNLLHAHQYSRRGETAVCIILSLRTDHGMGPLASIVHYHCGETLTRSMIEKAVARFLWKIFPQ